MERNPEVTSSNADAIVETIREISELVTWGDRHDPTMTEFFMEKRMLERMLQYLETGTRAHTVVRTHAHIHANAKMPKQPCWVRAGRIARRQ